MEVCQKESGEEVTHAGEVSGDCGHALGVDDGWAGLEIGPGGRVGGRCRRGDAEKVVVVWWAYRRRKCLNKPRLHEDRSDDNIGDMVLQVKDGQGFAERRKILELDSG